MFEDAVVLEPPRVRLCQAREVRLRGWLKCDKPLEQCVEVEARRVEVRGRSGEEVRYDEVRPKAEIPELVIPPQVERDHRDEVRTGCIVKRRSFERPRLGDDLPLSRSQAQSRSASPVSLGAANLRATSSVVRARAGLIASASVGTKLRSAPALLSERAS